MFQVTIYKNNAKVGQLGPYLAARSAYVDALSTLLNAGVPRSAVTELGKTQVRSQGWRLVTGEGKGTVISKKGGKTKRGRWFDSTYQERPKGYEGSKPDGTQIRAMITVSKTKALKLNPRRNGSSRRSAGGGNLPHLIEQLQGHDLRMDLNPIYHARTNGNPVRASVVDSALAEISYWKRQWKKHGYGTNREKAMAPVVNKIQKRLYTLR
jgi:hypothetical protein